MPLGDAPWDKAPLLGYQLKISPIGVTMGCRPRIWSPPPLQTATENCDRPKRWGSYEDKNVKVTVAIFQAHFSDPSCGGGFAAGGLPVGWLCTYSFCNPLVQELRFWTNAAKQDATAVLTATFIRTQAS